MDDRHYQQSSMAFLMEQERSSTVGEEVVSRQTRAHQIFVSRWTQYSVLRGAQTRRNIRENTPKDPPPSSRRRNEVGGDHSLQSHAYLSWTFWGSNEVASRNETLTTVSLQVSLTRLLLQRERSLAVLWIVSIFFTSLRIAPEIHVFPPFCFDVGGVFSTEKTFLGVN
jgi:hypothetical protein